MLQNTSHLLMIEPVNFGFNTETAANNTFQKPVTGNIQQNALEEFRSLVTLLQINKIDVTVVKDTMDPYTPDAIFPNNWISFHEDGSIFLYPMFAINRRLERKENVLKAIKEKFVVNRITDLSSYEKQNIYLEGTGSMVLDRQNRIAYACISVRTDITLFNEFCRSNNFIPLSFHANDATGVSIYHTNVMMCIGDSYAIICPQAINNDLEREKLITSIQNTNKEIISISPDQLDHFAGNMLQVINADNERILIISTQAMHSLNKQQVSSLEKHNRIVHSPLHNIEMAGGGSARCMIAEVFLQKK